MFSVTELRRWTKVSQKNISDSDLIDLESRVVSIIESETCNYFGPLKEVVEYITGSGERVIWIEKEASSVTNIRFRAMTQINRYDLVPSYYGIDSLYYDPITLLSGFSTGTWISLNNSDWRIENKRRITRLNDLWPDMNYEIEVTYIMGYEEDMTGKLVGIPGSISQLVLSVVGYILNSKTQEGRSRVLSGDVEVWQALNSGSIPFWNEVKSRYNLQPLLQ